MAIIFLFILSIVILAYQWSSFSTHKMFHHTYYAEKAIALLDGLTAIARGVVQKNLDTIIENMKKGETSELKQHIKPGGIAGAVVAEAESLKLIDREDSEGRRAIVPDVKVQVTLLDKDPFKTPYKTILPDEKEKTGRLEISIEVQFKGFRDDLNFKAAKKTAKTQFEFKKIRAAAPCFRHFSVFVKNGIVRDEKEEDFADTASNFNHLVNDRAGNTALSGGAIFVQNGPGLSQTKIPRINEENPYQKSLPYVYIGGDPKKKAFLNLAAGGGGREDQPEDSVYGEDFQLYRGATTDFYRVVATDFSNFIERVPSTLGGAAPADKPAKGSWWKKLKDMIKGALSRLGDFFKKAFQFFQFVDRLEGANPDLPSQNLPLYYVVRKDYGYASEWGDNPAYKKFGFGSGRVVSNSLHLYNSRSAMGLPTPTVVLGNVYRRCLSLSGYKQRRAADSPSVNRKFEVQAGPIEYFKTVDELFCHWAGQARGGRRPDLGLGCPGRLVPQRRPLGGQRGGGRELHPDLRAGALRSDSPRVDPAVGGRQDAGCQAVHRGAHAARQGSGRNRQHRRRRHLAVSERHG
ncbi:MAG: hypothetical protein HY815_20535 [Candidatus Riflebacteria bacterium]|nr:hypothetical protein [Candidatus Riflebacteria bacterium]